MSNRAVMGENFIVVPPLKGLVPEKVNFIVILLLDVLQAVSLVPAGGEDVETDLSADAVGHVQVGKLIPHCRDHVRSDVVLQVIFLVVVTFRSRAVPADGRNVEHATSKFDKCSALGGKMGRRADLVNCRTKSSITANAIAMVEVHPDVQRRDPRGWNQHRTFDNEAFLCEMTDSP
jgi:hypothetical protein